MGDTFEDAAHDLESEIKIKRGVLEWIKNDAPVSVKMALSPDLLRRLVERIDQSLKE